MLVGLRPAIKGERLRAGAHLLSPGAATEPANDEGYITSAIYSPHVESWIALGLLRRGPDRIGERVRVFDAIRNSDLEAEVVSPVFVDAAGDRLRV
jgi:sarcosine oxidase subunit alpha